MRHEREPICHIHDWCRAAIEGVIEDLDPEENHLQISTLREVQHALAIAKEKGQHMEDRLSEYREAIEELGFRRTK